MNKMTRKGFTLIELLIVVAVIGVLAALIIVNINGVRARARDVQRKSDLNTLKTALRMWYNDHGNQYPESSVLNGNWGAVWQDPATSVTYVRILPLDPIYNPTTGTPVYNYAASADRQGFCLVATLENASDSTIADSQARCSECPATASQYVACHD